MSNSLKSASLKPSPGLKGRMVIGLIKSIGLLPLGAARMLGSLIGLILWWRQGKASRVTLENLQIAYPELEERERRILARQSMIETGKLAIEVCVIQRHGVEWLKAKIFKTQGEDLIKRELAKGKGIIFLAPHLGNWEILGLTLPSYGTLTVLYQPPKEAYLESIIKNSREKAGAIVVPTSLRGIAKLLSSLRGGGITAILPDQSPSKGHGDFAPFFGEQAYTMTTAYGFLQRSDCAVFMGFVKRVPGGFESYFIEAPEGIYSDDQQESLVALNRGVEMCISYCPSQYQWEYKRYKRCAPNSKRRYQFS